MRLAQGRSGDVLSTRGTAVFGVALWLLTIWLLKQGWCGCTLFALDSWALIGTAVLLLGNRSFGVLAEEKEKKTLDCLRLTQLSPSALFWYKLSPEFRSLARLLAFTAPAVLLSSTHTSQGLTGGLAVLGIAALSGVMSIVSSLFVSSLASSTSRAVVQGWTLKACWLLLTPIFDLVVSAVTVTTQRYPVFDAVNPFAAVWPLVVPEAEMGLRQHLPLAFALLGTALCAGMWMVAARRYERGLTAAPTLTDRQVHRLYQQTPGWVPGFLGVRENPVFLRELAAQLRSGAGKWPGYAVFVTLFLAPFLYSQSWNVRRSSEIELRSNAPLRAASPTIGLSGPQLDTIDPRTGATTAPSPYVKLRSWNNDELHLKGHTNCACLRMSLYQSAHVPLPASQVFKVVVHDPYQLASSYSSNGDTPHRPGPALQPLSQDEARMFGVSNTASEIGSTQLSADTLNQIRLHSMGQGLLGCLVLLSLYLSVRCSGFLANAVTSECDRRSWTDLALTGIEPGQVLRGKLVGTLLMPVIQLLVASPSLLLFVIAGALSPQALFELVSYSVGLTATAGLLGFWASSASKTSHSAQGLALAAVMGWLVATPLAVASLGSALIFPLAGLGLMAALRGSHRGITFGWLALAVAAMISPMGLSPWTCLPNSLMTSVGRVTEIEALAAWASGMISLMGLASVCYFSTLANLQQPGQQDALRADRVA
ncbi:MAG: hypothetical protein KF760_22170 [Candidatus Eremiobacteraeota bacterium]|nr:hypothetical protein [Candidatus Eremiobacteraeota bacterium]MCW5866466.1 hypothetical protein [Candidatus Eremiobacteraeota bacterium]